jgi:hypothetical protein
MIRAPLLVRSSARPSSLSASAIAEFYDALGAKLRKPPQPPYRASIAAG